MVSTRRMESTGSTVDTVPHLSRGAEEAEDNSDVCSSSESEPSQEEESWSSQCPSAKQIRHRRGNSPGFTGRVRELRNRFVCSNISYSTAKSVRNTVVRNCRTLDERARVYSHEMQDDSDDFIMERDDSDEIFSPRRRHHSNHSRHNSSSRSRHSNGRMDRSLRPLKNQCYADPRSSMTQSNSSADEKPETDLRRSTRQRVLKYDTFNTSWITDAQMVRGYPNWKHDFLSDQDSRHSQENGHHEKLHYLRSASRKANHPEHSRDKSNRHNEENGDRREIKKNMKYIYDYETTEVRTRRVSLRGQPDEAETEDRNDKEAKKNGVDEETPNKSNRGKTRAKETDNNEMVNGEDGKQPHVNGDDSNTTIENSTKEENKESADINGTIEMETRDQEKNENKEEDADSESDQEIRRQRKRRRSNMNYMDDPRFSPRKTRSRKISDSEKSSDSSDEDIRNQRYKYQLRQRKPKKPESSGNNIPMSVPLRRSDRLLPSLCVRRHRDRRHSTSDGSNYSDVDATRSRKPNKGRNTNTSGADGQLKSGPVGTAPAPIEPEILDKKDWLDGDDVDGSDTIEMPALTAEVRFASVGGLDNHVRCLREMVLLPMMYPEIFRLFQIQPPRGVLFHGPPGTGKTLLARALANECSFGSRKVSFFMRKGADLLSKWVGESEKQLRLLFEQAAQMKPSIIFFDELDGLAPVRSSRQDQIHSSIVSTLLALMDGLDNRGEVIVIGATNRIDAIDPALRRPGRFDRELFFSLPARKEREDILRVHVSQWTAPPNDKLMAHLAETSAGYCGSDLRALCTEAVIQSLRRTYPQVYTTDIRLQLDASLVKVEKQDFLRARNLLVPASCRVTQRVSRKLPTLLEPLLRSPLDTVLRLFKDSFPHGLDPALANVKVSNGLHIAQLLLTGDTPAQGQSSYLAPALLYHMEHVNLFTLDLAALYKETARSPEETCIEVFNEARRNVPSVIYVPSIEQWWALVGETVRAIFLSQLSMLDPNIPILFLATANVEYKQLPEQISSIFSTYRKEVLHLSPPVTSQREAFFKPLITASLKPPKPPRARPKTPPPLPPAPTPSPPPITSDQLLKIQIKEESTLTELRIFLRDMCKKLASNKMFYMFTKPVDLAEVPDYLTIIKEPMDLETMMTKVDLHRYCSAQEFLTDIDLICNNALEYNPAKTSADKQIRHRACSLRDYAYALIKAEMDSDFEERCRTISLRRKERRTNTAQFLPPFIYTAAETEGNARRKQGLDVQQGDCVKEQQECPNNTSRLSPQRKRKVAMWARGYLGGKKRKRSSRHTDSQQDESFKSNSQAKSSGDESKENKPEEGGNERKEKAADSSTSTLTVPETPQSADMHIPLTVNCDTDHMIKNNKTSPLSSNASKKFMETLSPAIWPSFSDLLDDTAHLDDPELCEINERCTEDDKKVNIDQLELEKVLSYAVSVTKGCSVMALMDLYGQLNRVVGKYSRTYDRKTLPQDLQRELYRFHDIHKRPVTSTSRCTTSAS